MSTYKEFCILRDQRRAGEEAPQYTEEEAFSKAVDAAAGKLAYPQSLNNDLLDVLGMPNFMCAPIAHAYRDAGRADIPRKAEAEQAFVIDKLVRFVIQHGTAWRQHASEELGEIRDVLQQKQAGAA
jgi:hypothetical protein